MHISQDNCLQNSPIGVFYTDENGDCSYVNTTWCELTGLKKEQANQESWLEALHPEDREKCREEWLFTLAHWSPYYSEHRYQQDGEETWVKVEAFPTGEKGQQGAGYIGTMRRIAEKTGHCPYPLQQELMKINHITQNIVDKLRQPLTSICGYAAGLQKHIEHEVLTSDTLSTVPHKILNQANRVGAIIYDLAKQKEVTSPQDEDIDLETWLPSTLQQSKFTQLSCQYVIEPFHGHIRMVGQQLEQVLYNILENAHEAKPGTTVHIYSQQQDGQPLIILDNNGPRLTEEEEQRLLFPFFSTKPNKLGIGLSIAEEILHHYAGELQVTNKDSGVRFTLRLPKIRRETHEEDLYRR